MKDSTPLLAKQQLPVFQKITYGLGHVHNDLCASMWFSYTLGFLKLVNSNSILPGVLVMTGQLLDAIATPIAGFLIDNSQNKKKWHFIGSLLSACSFPLIYVFCTLCSNNTTWEGLYYGGCISLFQISWAFVQISHLSILPQLSRNGKDKADLTAYRHAASMLANILLYVISFLRFYGSEIGETSLLTLKDSQLFFEIAIIITAIGLITSSLFYFGIKLREPNQVFPLNSHTDRERTPRNVSNADLFKVAAVYTSSRLFINVTIEYMVVYLNETILSNKETIATIPLTLFASSAITSVVLNVVLHVKNQKITFGIGWLACIIGCALIFMRNGRNDEVGDLYVASSLFGVGSAMTLIVSMSFAANIASTEGSEGFVYSSVAFADKAINAIAIVLIEYLKCDDPTLCLSYYKNVMVYFNSALITTGLLLLCFIPIDIATLSNRMDPI